jgi:hypothetical protein
MIHESESKHPSADGVSCDAAEAHARTMEKLAEVFYDADDPSKATALAK